MKKWIVPVPGQQPIEVTETVDVFTGEYVISLHQEGKFEATIPATSAVYLGQAIHHATAESGQRMAKLAHQLADREKRRELKVKTSEARKIHDDDAGAKPPWEE